MSYIPVNEALNALAVGSELYENLADRAIYQSTQDRLLELQNLRVEQIVNAQSVTLYDLDNMRLILGAETPSSP